MFSIGWHYKAYVKPQMCFSISSKKKQQKKTNKHRLLFFLFSFLNGQIQFCIFPILSPLTASYGTFYNLTINKHNMPQAVFMNTILKAFAYLWILQCCRQMNRMVLKEKWWGILVTCRSKGTGEENGVGQTAGGRICSRSILALFREFSL